MKHKLLAASVGLSLACYTAAAAAGVTFTQVTTVDGKPSTVNRVMVDGSSARIEIVESAIDNPFMPPGSYMLMTDGSMFLVNPAQRTYARFDMAGMMGGAAGMASAFEITDVQVEKVLDEPGESIAGFATRHYQFKSSWTAGVANTPMKTQISTVEDIWTTDAVEVPALLGEAALPSGLQAVAEATALRQVEGLPLRHVTVQTTKTDMGLGGALGGLGARMAQRMANRVAGAADQTSTTAVEVRDVEETDLPAGAFELPQGFSETSLMQRGPAMPNAATR
jgi:hypothetical protein